MKNMIRTIIVAVILCMVLLTGVILTKILGVSFASSNTGQGDIVKVGNGKYKIISEYDAFVQYVEPVKKKAPSVTIPDTIKTGGKTYMVVSIGDGAFSYSCNTLKKVTIGSNVTCIGARAFRFCKKLKLVTIKTTHLTEESVKQLSFYDLNKKSTITVPEQKLKEYKKILKAAGLKGKNQKIKGAKMEDSNSFKNTVYDPDAEVPEPEVAMGINTALQLRLTQTKETDEYYANETIPIAMKAKMPQELFGSWELYMRDAGETYDICGTCGRNFEPYHTSFSFEDFWVHTYVPINDKCDCTTTNHIFGPSTESLVAWRKVWNNRACSAVFKITLPDGIDYKEGSTKVYQMFTLNLDEYYGNPTAIDESSYHTEVNGNEVIITIDDIRKFIPNANYHVYVELGTKLNNNASDTNVIEANLTYNYGEGNRTVNLNNVNVLKP